VQKWVSSWYSLSCLFSFIHGTQKEVTQKKRTQFSFLYQKRYQKTTTFGIGVEKNNQK
jgi:hypothetical protein